MTNFILTCIILFIPACWVIVGAILSFIWIKKQVTKAYRAICNQVNTKSH